MNFCGVAGTPAAGRGWGCVSHICLALGLGLGFKVAFSRISCDTPNPKSPLTIRQPAETLVNVG